MANEQNLRPPFSPSEAREQGRKGAEASAKARREKAMLRTAAEILLAKKVPPGEMEETLAEAGIKKSERTHAMAAVAGLIHRSIDGNPASFGKLMKLMGEGVGLEAEEDTSKPNNLFEAMNISALAMLEGLDDPPGGAAGASA